MGANVVRTFLQPVMDGLGAEGCCVREVLPRAVASDLTAAMRGKVGAPRQAGAMMAGFSLTAFAYATTRLGGTSEALSQHLLSRVRVWRA
jgi:hypothetical protein